MNIACREFLAFPHQLRGASVIEFSSVPHACTGENTDAYEARFGGESDGEAYDATVVNHIDADGNGGIFHDFRGSDGVRGRGFRLYFITNVVRQVPHIFDHQTVHAALQQRFGVA